MKTVFELEEIAEAKGKAYVKACAQFQAGKISKEDCQKIRDDWQDSVREFQAKRCEVLPGCYECCGQLLSDESN